MSFKILLDFKKYINGVLIAFVLQLISKTDGVAMYAPLQPQVDVVKLSYEAFITAVDAASDGGKTLIFLRNQSKKTMLKDLQKLVMLTELNANEDPAYALGAGFKIAEKPQRSNTPLPQPVLKYLRRGKKSGTVMGEVEDMPGGVRELCLLHSTDAFTTSTNGTNSSGKKFTIDLGITEQRVQVRAYFIGTFQRKSDLSEPMEVFVL